MKWVAISFGALDVADDDRFPGSDLLVTPALPALPLAFSANGASVWRRLVAGPVDEEALDASEIDIVHEMAEMGLASSDLEHPHVQREVREPWLSSPLHELVYALVSSVARSNGIDLFFFKGPILHAQGLRDRAHSGDVDIWVELHDINALSEALKPWGWSRRAETWVNHSVTLFPSEWGCELDLHHRFPGVSCVSGDTFDELMRRTEHHPFASIDCRVPERSVGAVLSALHIMRPEPGVTTPPQFFEDAAQVLARGGEAAIDAARALGSAAALEPALRSAFPDADLVDLGPIPANWKWRMKKSKWGAYAAALRSIPPAQLPHLVWRTVWPTDEVALATDHAMGGDARTPLQARLNRLKGLLRTARSAE